MALDHPWASAAEIVKAVAAGETTALAVTEAALDRIGARNPALNAFTAVTRERALAKARAVDAARAQGRAPGPLAGAPFAVKNLFDIAGLPTAAGSKINRTRPPATRDATLIERLEAQAPSSWAPSTWGSMPTTSQARTCTTDPRAIRTTPRT